MRVLAVVGILVFAAAAQAQTDPITVHNRQIVAQTQAADSIFTVLDDGNIRHEQSTFVCPADFPNVHLTAVQIFAADGSDVGCDYGRTAPTGLAVSKLTIFLTKAPADATLESVFLRYKAEVMQAHPDAVAEAPTKLTITDSTGGPRTDYRTAAFAITIEQKRFHSELIVGLIKGWMLEVRATYPNAIVQVDKTTTKQEIADQVNDIKSPYLAFIFAQDSLEGERSGP